MNSSNLLYCDEELFELPERYDVPMPLDFSSQSDAVDFTNEPSSSKTIHFNGKNNSEATCKKRQNSDEDSDSENEVIYKKSAKKQVVFSSDDESEVISCNIGEWVVVS